MNVYRIASIVALVVAIGLASRMTCQKAAFSRVVNESHKTSEGYDRLFINMVMHLEEILAARASFGYPGGKDPMTGQTRQVVAAARTAPRPGSRPARPGVAERRGDPLKLTAVIFDDNHKQYTAIIMDAERSFSVEVGDVVAGRKVIRITQEGVLLESPTHLFFFDIHGNRQEKAK